MMQLSQRVLQVKPSATLTITARALAMRAAGKPVISLSVGEPEFPTAEHVKQAAITAIEAGYTRYTATPGIPNLRQAICNKFLNDNQLNYTAEHIVVSTGGKQCLYNMCQALLNKGDEVIIPAPYWVSYPEIVRLAAAVPVIVSAGAEQGFRLTPTQLEAAITPKTRLLMLNSPSNPTGAAYDADELRALGEVLQRHPNVCIASDEIYEKILFDGREFACFATVNPELIERTIVINGVSKAHCMTGWRIGYCAAPLPLAKAMVKIQAQSTSNACSIAQWAALAALQGSEAHIDIMRSSYQKRSNWLVGQLNALDGVHCLQPDGAFYVFPDVQGMINRLGLEDDVALCAYILEKAHVALVPGTAFGLAGHIRFSYAVAQETLEDAMQRIINLS
ncbi:MAG: pyridoxal phosphate-dependent aminotransferase [Mariprofundales bacterium]